MEVIIFGSENDVRIIYEVIYLFKIIISFRLKYIYKFEYALMN